MDWVFKIKVEKVLKFSLDLIPSPSPSVKTQIMGMGKLALGVKAKHCWALSTNFLKSKVCCMNFH